MGSICERVGTDSPLDPSVARTRSRPPLSACRFGLRPSSTYLAVRPLAVPVLTAKGWWLGCCLLGTLVALQYVSVARMAVRTALSSAAALTFLSPAKDRMLSPEATWLATAASRGFISSASLWRNSAACLAMMLLWVSPASRTRVRCGSSGGASITALYVTSTGTRAAPRLLLLPSGSRPASSIPPLRMRVGSISGGSISAIHWRVVGSKTVLPVAVCPPHTLSADLGERSPT